MKVVYWCCCGLDIHLRQIVACLMTGSPPHRQKEIRTFGTTTEELQQLAVVADWHIRAENGTRPEKQAILSPQRYTMGVGQNQVNRDARINEV
jgi:hypothetical protein